MAKTQILRKAGEALGIGGRLKAAITGDPTKKIDLADLAGTFGFDLLFGGLAAAQTPGDIGDKLIAGGAQAIGGGLGGVALTAAVGPQRLGKYRFLTDMAGSVGGDFAGLAVGDQVMKGKDLMMGGKGQTPYERMSTQQQEEYAKMLRQQILTEYGIVPGTREQYAMDPSTGMGVS
jgi:hypothetical protein